MAERGRDVDEVVAEVADGGLGVDDRVGDVGVLVEALEDVGEALAERVELGVGAGVGLEAGHRHDVLDGAEAGTHDEHLRERKEGHRKRGVGGVSGRDLADGEEVHLGVGRGLLGQQGPVVRHR